jgi:hypothetical protein
VRIELVGLALTGRPVERAPPPAHVHLDKPGRLDRRDVLSFQESAANSGRPDGNVISRRCGNLLVQDDVGDLEPTAWL